MFYNFSSSGIQVQGLGRNRKNKARPPTLKFLSCASRRLLWLQWPFLELQHYKEKMLLDHSYGSILICIGIKCYYKRDSLEKLKSTQMLNKYGMCIFGIWDFYCSCVCIYRTLKWPIIYFIPEKINNLMLNLSFCMVNPSLDFAWQSIKWFFILLMCIWNLRTFITFLLCIFYSIFKWPT